MTVIGYARVSTTDQDLDVQTGRLKAAGCEIIRSEKVSGKSREGRDELSPVIDFIRAGDTLVGSSSTGSADRPATCSI
jgi:DNA invertase Pin-like site-specific DNA recombinase